MKECIAEFEMRGVIKFFVPDDEKAEVAATKELTSHLSGNITVEAIRFPIIKKRD